MDIQKRIKEWIIGELKARGHGSKSKLAAHLGVRPDAITRMLNLSPNKEVRFIHAEELVKISEFFGSPPPGIGEIKPSNDDDFLRAYNAADDQTKEELKRYLRFLTESKRT